MKATVCGIISVALLSSVRAAIHTQNIEYKQGETVLEGYVAYDDAVHGKRPGVLVVHQWKGLTDYEKQRTDMLAKLGYVAFAADIYGKGIRPADPREAEAEAGKYKANRLLLRERVNAGLRVLKSQPRTDPQRVAAIGYCFGGLTVMELARSGAELAGVVSFHGALDSPTPADGRNIRCKVLALHGADDPFVSAKDLAAFEEELRSASVDWQLIKYGGAVHSFTEVHAGSLNIKGAAYNAAADRRSWAHMRQFFSEIFN